MGWQFWRKKPVKQEIQYGLKSKPSKGFQYFADGNIQGFPFFYRLVAVPIGRGKPSEETTILYRQIIGELSRLEKRDPHKRAIYALFFYRSPNFAIKFTAFSSKGKEIILLDEGLYISVPGRDTVTLVRRICEDLGAIASGLYTNTKELDFISQRAMRESLLYGSPRTNQFWLAATISAYVRLTHNP